MKLLAMDGNSIFNRAFYGIKLLSTKDGQYTNAIYGFIQILGRLKELVEPDAIAVAFDLRAPTFRHKKYAEYKAGRKGMPDELAVQLPPLKEWLTLMGYDCLEVEGYEADDILGTLAQAASDQGETCVIATGDRDALQLISKNVHVLLTTTKMGRPEVVEYDEEKLKERYGLTPPQMIELKALMGDASDHIPGVPGIGEKTALALISQYGSVDAIYSQLDSLDLKPGVKAKLEAGRDSAYLSRELGTICCTVPIETDLKAYLPKPRQDAKLAALMTRLEFFKLMEKWGIDPAATPPVAAEPAREVAYCADAAALVKKASEAKSADLYPDFENGAVGLFAAGQAGIVPADDPALLALLADPAIEKRVYDAKAFYHFYADGLQSVRFDSLLAGYLASPSASSYDLERLAQEYGATNPAFEQDDVPPLVCRAALAGVVAQKLQIPLEQNGLMHLLQTIELPLSKVLADMEHLGFAIDRQSVAHQGEVLEKRIAEIEAEIYRLVGETFNLNSPKQLGEILFVKLGLPAKKKTKSGYSTNAEVLESLRDAHPAVSLLLEYRQLAKLKSTYCDGLLKAVGPDGRIHSTFNQTETRTGRISSTEPNLQNIPVRQEEGRQLRRFFVAKPGYVLCDADYSQIELRVLAHIAGDTAMIRAFNEGVDIHTLTASQVFGLPPEMVTPLMRSRAKAVNFGIVYGIGAFSLSKDIGVTRAEASQYIKGYLATYPQVDAYMHRIIEQAKADGFVTTLFGRRRYLPELSSSNAAIRAFGERVARNMPIQGTAADIIKIAMIRVYDRLKREGLDAQLILQVHDELIVEAREDQAERACQILKEEMEHAADLSVKLLVDVHSGKTWYDAKS